MPSSSHSGASASACRSRAISSASRARPSIPSIAPSLRAKSSIADTWRPLPRSTVSAAPATLEQGATAITEFGVMTVPGLLQTREYATAVLASGETGGITAREVQRRVEQRLRRQAALHRDHDAVRVTAILDESVLRRQVGGPDVLRAQLGHLSEISTLPNVSIRVLPYTTVVPIALSGPFIQMQFGLPGDDGLVYVEDRLGGRVIDDPDSIDEYTLVTSALLDESLSAADSRTMIDQSGDHL
ncbi:DUF5753 domain-containing protein [Saccharopolyspora sp. CA-218241]|uniref:DUF5753 domain-containing protein n=1 Tax=Saccharopolyspora sp. CA-218241 TaxID=3240027 RepID=UPI003D9826F3